MTTANQLTFTTYELSLNLRANDPIKVIFDNIDWSFIYTMAGDKYSPEGAGAMILFRYLTKLVPLMPSLYSG